MRRPARLLLVAGALGWGCAYYNGLYNANRLAGDAARARREGRTGEARAMWQQAAVKAESVAIRFRRSKYRDDALLLQGRALLESGQCERAIAPLSFVVDSGPDPSNRRRARLLLGECRVVLGDPERAGEVLTPLVDDGDVRLARSARVWRARAALAKGDYAGALSDLTGNPDTSGSFDRVTAMLGLGQTPEAVAALIQLAPGGYDERRWPDVLDRLGATTPGEAGALVDSLVRRGTLSPGQRARLLLGDAKRWEAAGNRERSARRLEAAAALAPDSSDGRVARTRLLLAEIAGMGDADRVPGMVAALEAVRRDGGEAAVLATPAFSILSRLNAKPANELRRFVLIEAVRDTLHAVPLAATLFRNFQREFPGSPIAPKALLAAAALAPDSAADLVARIRTLYPDSPYRLTLEGSATPAFTVIEDSLRVLMDSMFLAESDRVPPRAREGIPVETRRPRPPTGRQLPEP